RQQQPGRGPGIRRRSPRMASGRSGDGERRRGQRLAMARGAEPGDDDSAASGEDPAGGRMSAPVVNVDFVARRSRVTLAGALLLLLGASAAAGTYAEYRFMQARRAGLELKLEAAARRNRHDPGLDARNAGFADAAVRRAEQLGTPWTKLLAELEAASRDSTGQIAVLSIEPDPVKRNVHITGESKDLPQA